MTSQTLSSLAARSQSQKRCNEHIAWPSCARMATLHMNVHFRIFQKGQAPIKRSRQRKWPQACPYLDIMASFTCSPAHLLTPRVQAPVDNQIQNGRWMAICQPKSAQYSAFGVQRVRFIPSLFRCRLWICCQLVRRLAPIDAVKATDLPARHVPLKSLHRCLLCSRPCKRELLYVVSPLHPEHLVRLRLLSVYRLHERWHTFLHEIQHIRPDAPPPSYTLQAHQSEVQRRP